MTEVEKIQTLLVDWYTNEKPKQEFQATVDWQVGDCQALGRYLYERGIRLNPDLPMTTIGSSKRDSQRFIILGMFVKDLIVLSGITDIPTLAQYLYDNKFRMEVL